jgi:hypothetical protein
LPCGNRLEQAPSRSLHHGRAALAQAEPKVLAKVPI